MRLLRRRKPARTCPLCREELGEDSATPCHGCGTIYHDACLSELGDRCAVPGCGERVRRRTWPDDLELGPQPQGRPPSYPTPEPLPERLAANRRRVRSAVRRDLFQEFLRDVFAGGVASGVLMLVMFLFNAIAIMAPHRSAEYSGAAFLALPAASGLFGWLLSQLASRDGPGSYGPFNALILTGGAVFWLLGARPAFVGLITFVCLAGALWPALLNSRARL